MNKEPKKDRMFQYGYNNNLGTEIPENTGLITKDEAYALWEKYLKDFIYRLENGQKPEMVIWCNCESDTAYHTEEKELYWDCVEVEDGEIYKITKQEQ